ncbi:EamA family transporter [Advenella alkanexedens]|uniref:EamA family transporter n=1 Tax=Advenella alkanexedens TaxID=1481665 RepID=A0ABS6NKT7_9BURK|nr:EamA family transporter [Advenella alkanexedens]MBV4396249.1 EamA family transporter [Advenella alkanexedens]
MPFRFTDHLYIFATIAFTVYGQLILKWRMVQLGEMPVASAAKLKFLIMAVFDPAIFSGFFAAFLASLAWMAAMTKFELSYAYPFMSLNFVIVLLLSAWLLHEPITMNKTIGMVLIVVGTVIASRT